MHEYSYLAIDGNYAYECSYIAMNGVTLLSVIPGASYRACRYQMHSCEAGDTVDVARADVTAAGDAETAGKAASREAASVLCGMDQSAPARNSPRGGWQIPVDGKSGESANQWISIIIENS